MNKKRRWGVFTGPPGGIEKMRAARTGVLERAWMDVTATKCAVTSRLGT